MKKIMFIVTTMVVSLFMFGCENNDLISKTDKKDHRDYSSKNSEKKSNGSFSAQPSSTSSSNQGAFGNVSKTNSSTQNVQKNTMSTKSKKSKNIGFQGGADQDMMHFRNNIKNGHIPSLESITYNGIFSDYHFKQPKGQCEEMFCPLVENGKIDGENWMQISLGSNIKEKDFNRPPTNFVVVIDKSGSMGSSLSEYYYEDTEEYIYESELCPQEDNLYFKPGKKCIPKSKKNEYKKDYKKASEKTKMELAMESMAKMTDKFKKNDRIGIVLYDNNATVAHDLVKVKNIDKPSLKKHLKNVTDDGGTNMESGMKKGLSLFDDDKKNGYQNRLLFLTDAMPNMGDYSEEGLASMVKDASKNNIYFSFFGVGVDFQQQFIQKIGKFEGNNYFFISDAWEFSKRIVDEFDYNFFPMIFDLKMSIDDKNKVEEVYGLDNDGKELMSMNTLFPTPPTTEGHRGSIMLLKLKEKLEDNISMKVSFEEYTGKEVETTKDIKIENNKSASQSIKKGVNLVKYADALKESVKESDTSILNKAKNRLKENKEIFSGEDKKIFKKELETIDKLKGLIREGEEVKPDYEPNKNNRDIEK